MLYETLEAKVKVNNEQSDKFRLMRGMRQGCPLSPLLFTLAVKPLAIALRSSPEIKGYKRGEVEEKVLLYVDDLLLLLGDSQNSLRKSMENIKNFGQFSGLTLNWEKSTLLPVDPLESPLPQEVAQIQIVNQMKYLGINIS